MARAHTAAISSTRKLLRLTLLIIPSPSFLLLCFLKSPGGAQVGLSPPAIEPARGCWHRRSNGRRSRTTKRASTVSWRDPGFCDSSRTMFSDSRTRLVHAGVRFREFLPLRPHLARPPRPSQSVTRSPTVARERTPVRDRPTRGRA
jgi:hypothetical protein